MEAAVRNIDLPVESQPLLVLRHFQIAGQTRFQTEGFQTNVVADVDRQVAVDRDPGALLINRLEVFVEHHFIRRHANRALRHLVDHDPRPGHIHLAIEVEQAWRGGKHHVRRYIETDHRRHRDPHPAAFRRNLRLARLHIKRHKVAVDIHPA